MDKRLNYKIFWSWDHSTNWVLNQTGAQNCGVANPYTKPSETFVRDYKRVVDWCKAHGMDAVGIVGLLRDRHGGVDAVRKLCTYANERGVRIYMIAGLYAYGGIYYEGTSKWSLDNFLRDNPDCMGQDADGKPLWMEHKSPIGVKTEPQGCPSNPKLNQFVLDSLEWVFHEIPELGGIQMESGDYGTCKCPRCQERRAQRDANELMSVVDMLNIYPQAANAVWSQSPDAWVICETYHHFLDKACKMFYDSEPSADLQNLLAMPEKTFFQWWCDARLDSGQWSSQDHLPASLTKFRHIMRAHSGTQWLSGRHRLCIDRIRRQCKLSYESGLQGVSMFGESSPFNANDEFNYLAFQYFADAPFATVDNFVTDVMTPLLGSKEYADLYLNLWKYPYHPNSIPAQVTKIGKIIGEFAGKDYEVMRRWQWLATFLNSFYWEWRATQEG
ncbi:MAG: hypothetical protein J6X55_11125 [Victivallales bacterium]|nr:hypothetical protein [Victivallales bacterium]